MEAVLRSSQTIAWGGIVCRSNGAKAASKWFAEMFLRLKTLNWLPWLRRGARPSLAMSTPDWISVDTHSVQWKLPLHWMEDPCDWTSGDTIAPAGGSVQFRWGSGSN